MKQRRREDRRLVWQRRATTVSLSLAAHVVLLGFLGWIVFAVIEEPQTEAVVSLVPPMDSISPTPRDGNAAAGGAPSLETVSETPLSEALAAPLPSAPLPAELGAPAEAIDALISLDPAASDPALAILATLADAPAATADVGVGANPLLDGINAGTLDGIGQIGRRGLDVVFVLDATGSMRDEIRIARQRIYEVHNVLTGILQNADVGEINIRYGAVAFKDYGDDYGLNPTKVLPLTEGVEPLKKFLDQVSPSGGGADLAEPIDMALRAATDVGEMGWKKRRHSILILITDAPVHSTGRKKAIEESERFHRRVDGTINVIDVGKRNADDGTIQRDYILGDLAQIADAGGGSAFLLDGNSDAAFWKHLVVSIFPKRFEHDVALIVERYAKGTP